MQVTVPEVQVDRAVLVHQYRFTILMFLVSQGVQDAAHCFFTACEQFRISVYCAQRVQYNVLVWVAKSKSAELS